jgi:hypothetical protein
VSSLAPPVARRLLESYEPGFRATLTLPPERADDPDALLQAASTVPEPARALLELLSLVVPVGEALPERLRSTIDRDGRPLWSAALLLPRATASGGADIHPLRYAGACRLNPALRDTALPTVPVPAVEPTPTFPPSDARWDAVVVAAALEAAPAGLTAEGTLRKDFERRLFSGLGPDLPRWALALRVARLSALVRPSGAQLLGYPEAVARRIADPVALFPEAPRTQAAAALLRLLPPVTGPSGGAWVDTEHLSEVLRERCRQLLWSPVDGRYPDGGHAFDAASWDTREARLFLDVLDTLHRAGVIDAARAPDGRVVAARRAGDRPAFAPGFMLLPDGDVLVHSGELSGPDYGRLARLAPYVDGARMHRHRLSREGAAADMAAGHRDTVDFLASHSRTGVPPGVADAIRDWQRAAQRIVVLSGVDVLEHEDGRLTVLTGAPPAEARVIDYGGAPRARFLYHRGRILVPDGWDALTVRSAVLRVARAEGRDADGRVYVPELRRHGAPGPLLAQLRAYFGGELPGEVEALVLAGSDLAPLTAAPAYVVRLPAEAAGALRRDWIAGPLLRRALGADEAVVDAADVAALRDRVRELGLRWEEPTGA